MRRDCELSPADRCRPLVRLGPTPIPPPPPTDLVFVLHERAVGQRGRERTERGGAVGRLGRGGQGVAHRLEVGEGLRVGAIQFGGAGRANGRGVAARASRRAANRAPHPSPP